MSEKTYLCNGCGRWNEDGEYVYVDWFEWSVWFCAKCVREEDPYIEKAAANPERRDNGCMIYRRSA
jgi:hypothetical protein